MRAIAKVTSPVPLRYVLFIVVLGMLAAALTAGPMLSPGPAESAFPGANGKIAFRSGRDGNSEIYVMNADGSAQTNLSNNPADDFYPAWSPDGSKIAFSSDRDGDYEIYVMNADGTGQTQITNNTAYDADPAWSPDGSKIAFNRQVLTVWPYGADIYVMNADGSAQTSVTNNGLSGVWNGDGDWSPDGSKIAFSRGVFGGDSEVYVMNADGSAQTNLTNNPGGARSYADVVARWVQDRLRRSGGCHQPRDLRHERRRRRQGADHLHRRRRQRWRSRLVARRDKDRLRH